jgi:ABC-2 type transport system permease protein
MMLFTVAGRELRSLFLSPLAWAVSAVFTFVMAWIFLSLVEAFLVVQGQLAALEEAPGVTEVVAVQLFDTAAIVLMLVTPLLTMRLVSEELRARTLTLLFSAPLSMTEIVLGKYLGAMGFFCVLLGLLAAMPLSLGLGTQLDYGLLASALLGLFLLTAGFVAAGLFLSTLTAQPTVAAVTTLGLLLLLWVIDWAGSLHGETETLLGYLSLSRHHRALLEGAFNSKDVVYYLLFGTTFLVLSIRRLDAYRLGH